MIKVKDLMGTELRNQSKRKAKKTKMLKMMMTMLIQRAGSKYCSAQKARAMSS